MTAKAMLRLKEVKHPISEETIGFRLLAAIPNKAGKAFGKPVPSFRKPYLLAETSDCSEAQLEIHFEKMMSQIQETLSWKGYKETYFVD